MNLSEEFKEYETLWDNPLLEWQIKTTSQQTQNTNSTTSSRPLSKYGLPSYKIEFLKLAKHLNTIHTVYLEDDKYTDWGVNDHALRLYFVDDKIDFRLEITTTEVEYNGNSYKRVESWDWVLEEIKPYPHIIDRGPLKDYDELLDKLLQYGVIGNKSKCK